MYITEITPNDVMKVLIENGFVSTDRADDIYCSIMRNSSAQGYAKQMKKPAEFMTKQCAKSACLVDAWKAVLNMKHSFLHEIMPHIIGLVALYIHCTEDIDKDYLLAYTREDPIDKLLKDKCFDWTFVRRACVNMETRVQGRHSFYTLHSIRYCLAKLVDYIVSTPEKIPEVKVSRQFTIDDIESMFDDTAKESIFSAKE